MPTPPFLSLEIVGQNLSDGRHEVVITFTREPTERERDSLLALIGDEFEAKVGQVEFERVQ